jgi:hypothetical protein
MFQGWWFSKCSTNDHQCSSNWSHKGSANTNCAQKSKLFYNRQLTLFPRTKWCFIMNHWEGWNLTSFVWIPWWVLWRPFCGSNHNRKDFTGKLLLAQPLQGCPWLLQELWCMSSVCTKVYYEWAFTPHTTFRTFWKMGNWFNQAIASD